MCDFWKEVEDKDVEKSVFRQRRVEVFRWDFWKKKLKYLDKEEEEVFRQRRRRRRSWSIWNIVFLNFCEGFQRPKKQLTTYLKEVEVFRQRRKKRVSRQRRSWII